MNEFKPNNQKKVTFKNSETSDPFILGRVNSGDRGCQAGEEQVGSHKKKRKRGEKSMCHGIYKDSKKKKKKKGVFDMYIYSSGFRSFWHDFTRLFLMVRS